MAGLAASNPRIARLRRLSGRRSARVEAGVVVLEGPVVVGEALARRVPLTELYVEPGAADQLADAARAAGVEVHLVAAGVLDRVTDTVTPRPVLALAPRRPAALDDVLAGAAVRRRPVLALVEVRDPGNVGTVVRTAEATGAAGVVCTVGTADPTSPKAVRASAGTVLDLPVVDGVHPHQLLAAARAAGLVLVATVAVGGADPVAVDLAGAPVVMLGGEAHGLPAEVVAAADVHLTVPVEGRAESLNVAVTAGMLGYEALRQRRARAAGRTDWTAPTSDDTVFGP